MTTVSNEASAASGAEARGAATAVPGQLAPHWQVLHALRPAVFPTLVSLAAAALMVMVPGARDVIDQSLDGFAGSQFVWFLIALTLFAASCWWAARILLSVHYAWLPWGPSDEPSWAKRARVYGPLLLMLPPVIPALWQHPAWSQAPVPVVLALIGALLTFVWRRPPERLSSFLPGRPLLNGAVLLVAALLVSLVLCLASLSVPRWFGTAAIFLSGLALLNIIGLVLGCWLMRWPNLSTGWVLVLAAALVVGIDRWGGFNDHVIPELPSGDSRQEELEAVVARPTLERRLAQWLTERAALSSESDPYPLLVVAAPGGRRRAAYWTAGVLGALQDRDPAFACHVLAITAISGGAQGALTFRGLLDAMPGKVDCKQKALAEKLLAPVAAMQPRSNDPEERVCPDMAQAATFEQAATCIIGQDHLAPLAARLIGYDAYLGWIKPAGGDGGLFGDRHDVLEQSFAETWREWRAQKEPEDKSTQLDWNGGFLSALGKAQATKPALYLIAADVTQGRRWIASDLRVDPNTFTDAIDMLTGRELSDACDESTLEQELKSVGSDSAPALHALTAVAAAGASYRFPWISPSGRLTAVDDTVRRAHGDEDLCLNKSGETVGQPPRLRTARLIDGGLVESSAAGTAAEVLRFLASHCDVQADNGAWPGVLSCRADKHTGTVLRPSWPGGASGQLVHVRPAVLQLSNDAWDERDTGPHDSRAPGSQGGLEPVAALWNSRTGRGRQAYHFLGQERTLMAGRDDLAYDIALEGDEVDEEEVPLTWTISESKLKRMSARLGKELKSPRLRD